MSTFVVIAYLAMINSVNAARISGIYSNMYYHEEACDLIGQELLIFPGCNNYCVLVQFAEGGAPGSELLDLWVNGNKIKFTHSENGRFSGAVFSGVVHESKIVGEYDFKTNKFTIELKRGESYWQ